MKKVFATLTLLVLSIHFCGAQNVSRFEVEKTFVWKKDTLSGTLLSKGKKISKIHKLPIVLFISGSGPTDRDGNSKMAQGPNNSFSQLADSLLKHGIASYRYDKLGVGKSQYSGDEEDMRFGNNVEVALNAVKKLQDLGFKKIFIAGHSQGSLVGMLAAQKGDVDGFISMEGSAANAFDLMSEQLNKVLPEPMRASTIRKLDSIKNGYTVTSYSPMLASLLRKSLQPYLVSYFSYTPTEEITKLNIPVLIIQGGRDLQTTTKEGENLRDASTQYDYLFYENMNHVLKQVDESQQQNLAAYSDPDFPLPKTLANDLAAWINSH